ncbi:MAG TPA: HD domain-containing protein [Acidimicrobiia bacterium]|nr:HD domain-containing protein [Acidimicrobiia bacterium]
MNALDGFLETRRRLRDEGDGDGGLDTCAALTTALDTSIERLFGEVAGDSAVVALGSYGRRELCLWSDVDLMLLHAGADTDRLVKAVFYPLWDANLKVGHSVRTVRDCVAAARDRIDSMTSLLSARLVSGDRTLLAELEKELAKVVSGRPLAPHLASLERERRRKDPYPVMAADVKSGRGALRTYQALGWERRRTELLGRIWEDETVEERAARSTLLAVRNGLHAAEGRAFDVYDFDVREQVARWLGSDVATVSRTLCRALQLGDRLAEKRWPDLLSSDDPVARLGRRVLGRVGRRLGGGSGGQPVGPLGAAVRTAAASGGVSHAGWAELSDPSQGSWSESERGALLDLIASGEPGRVVFGWLEEAGWTRRNFPEWEAISAKPQLAAFHEHPVDAHLWRTTDEMIHLIREPDAIGAEILADFDSAGELLLLSAFLHDIGKGVDGDHSEQGADVAAAFLDRAGFAPSTVKTVSSAVRHHLLLARTALRRDIASPEVVDEVAGKVGKIKILQILYLLTIADSKATGRTMWSEWKETLLRQLYLRVAARLEHGEALPVVEAEAVAILTMGRLRPEAVDRHLAMLPADYAVATEPGDVVSHLEVISELAEDTILSVSASGEQVLLVGHDKRGFLLSVCRAFAANGIGVHDARLYTRSDGVVIDIFEVRDDRSGRPVEADRWPRVEKTLAGLESNGRALRDMVRQRAAAYDSGRQMPVTVRARPELPQLNTVLEVRATDRVGLLVDIVEALYAEGLDLHLARIDTRANQAIDVLHVSRSGAPVRDDEEVAALCRRLEDRIRGQLSG